jgi:hypothetical protein
MGGWPTRIDETTTIDSIGLFAPSFWIAQYLLSPIAIPQGRSVSALFL